MATETVFDIASGTVTEKPYTPGSSSATPAAPQLFAAVTVNITAGVISSIELAAQLQGAMYDDGWLMIGFADPQETANYMVFAQTDIPAKIEVFKDTGAFELVFSDPAGDPIEPAQVNVQILKVR